MKFWSYVGMLATLGLVGCQPLVYTVRFTNNSPQTTDFVVDERGIDNDTFAPDVPGMGGKMTVVHQSRRRETNIASGTLIGQQLGITDATCSARVTTGDIVEVVKQPTGELTCTVIPGSPLPDQSSTSRRLRGLFGQ